MADNAPGAKFYHANPSKLCEVFKQARWTSKREYKLGIIGELLALLRASLPVSFVVGNVISILRSTPSFIIFKLIYDFGVFVGIIELIIKRKKIK
jgi:hypothetical protein